MSDEPDSLVLRYLSRMDDNITAMQADLSEIKADLRGMKMQDASLVQGHLSHDQSLANLRARMDRVERRLDLREDLP